MKDIFNLDLTKDLKLIKNKYKYLYQDKLINVTFLGIDQDGYYIFKNLDKNIDIEEFLTKVPNEDIS